VVHDSFLQILVAMPSVRMLCTAIMCEHHKSRTIVLVGLILIPESDRLPEEFQQVAGGSGRQDLLRPDPVIIRFSEASATRRFRENDATCGDIRDGRWFNSG
jgi:hypothetical protein